MYAKAIVFRNSVVIDYVSERKNLRLFTGVSDIKPEELVENAVVKSVEGYFLKNKIINDKLKQVDKIIEDFIYKNGVKPTIHYIKEQIKEAEKLKEKKLAEAGAAQPKRKTFSNVFEDFYSEKQKDPIQRQSLKDYVSMKNSVLAYNKLCKPVSLITINSVEFLKDFQYFLSAPIKEEKDLTPEEKKFKFRGTQGGLNNNTIRKRISTLKTFLKWCLSQRIIEKNYAVEDFKSNVKRYQPTLVYLKLDEQKKIENLKLEGKEEKLRDVLLFLCKTGIRYSDLNLTKDDIKSDNTLAKSAEKTEHKFKVPLSPLALSLLKKYNYNLNIFTTGDFNKYIKELLEKHKICDYLITIRELNYSDKKSEQVKKYSKICSHTGRRSFIMNCLNIGYSISQIMQFSGHSKISSLQVYIDEFQLQGDLMKRMKQMG